MSQHLKEIPQKQKCSHCGYLWNCRSKLKFVSCPNCMQKTRNCANELGDTENDGE
jgi:Zn finger protein HypA/HybF involved in hydrogenase expression